MDRAVTTLYMLSSVDGKISTGKSDNLDFDQDFPQIAGLKEGLHQYYEIEQTTDLWSLNSGRVQSKIGVNTKTYPQKSEVSFVVIDNQHLNEHGINYFCHLAKEFVLVTTNKNHPAYHVLGPNLHIIYQEKLNLEQLLVILKHDYNCQRITIQTGGTLNALFVRKQLIDYVDIVVAPVLVGGAETASLVDGVSFTQLTDLASLGILEFQKCTVLEDSYLRLQYRVRK